MNKKWILTCCFLILVYTYFIYNPIIIDRTNDDDYSSVKDFKKNDKIKIFDSFDFEKGNWKACVVINETDDISPNIPRGRYLSTSDKKIIQRLKDLTFEYTGGDVATVSNEFILYENDEVVFRSYIVLDENYQGFQNHNFGWIKDSNNNLSSIIEEFSLNFSPIVNL